MSLDLLKNALYVAVTTYAPGLLMYPEHIDSTTEAFPNLSYIDLATRNNYARYGLEKVQIPTGLALPSPPFYTVPVIARKWSTIRMQLRDSVGSGNHDITALNKIRATFNQVDRFLTETRAVKIGAAPGQTLAEIWYRTSNTRYDKAAGIFLGEFEFECEWRCSKKARVSPPTRPTKFRCKWKTSPMPCVSRASMRPAPSP
jgi:hypothetical protein